MREHVPFLDTNKMEWTPGERPGLFTKMLSRDPEVGARTALQRIVPESGYGAPDRPHYHDSDEEIFIVKGSFTFDGKTWLRRASYCFHPTYTVHGFRSQVAEESWFLSRIKKPLNFFFSDDYRDEKPYNLKGEEPTRGISVVPYPEEETWEEIKDENGEVILRQLWLSRCPETGEGSKLVEFQPGWVSPHGAYSSSVYKEVFVMDGEIIGDDGTVWESGCYSFKPPQTVTPHLRSPKGALCYVNVGGDLDFIPA